MLSNAELIKRKALQLGFDACGIAPAEAVSDASFLQQWLDEGCAAEMNYMHNHFDKRTDPRLLVEDARSIVVVALNYYPSVKRDPSLPEFSSYAYGLDYHDVIKKKLFELLKYINDDIASVQGRAFTDSAPVLERYWAVRAGLGFIGKNTQLIIPGKGSYFFLGELIIDLPLDYDHPQAKSCGSCRKCLDACPATALKPYKLDGRRCLSYQTIENRGEIDSQTKLVIGNHVYGCDDCQKVCPWNSCAKGNQTPEFQPSEEFLNLDMEKLRSMTDDDFRRIFKGSAVKRAGLKGLSRNVGAIIESARIRNLSDQDK